MIALLKYKYLILIGRVQWTHSIQILLSLTYKKGVHNNNLWNSSLKLNLPTHLPTRVILLIIDGWKKKVNDVLPLLFSYFYDLSLHHRYVTLFTTNAIIPTKQSNYCIKKREATILNLFCYIFLALQSQVSIT
jgi:hypothetical protein